jgi:DNA-binding MarR family transcriptional regulator
MARDDLFQELERATLYVMKGMHKQMPRSSCSPAQSHMLMVIDAEKPITVKELAARLNVTSGATTQHIEELERMGLATRQPHPDDRRKVVVTLTRRGRSTAKAAAKFKRQMLNELFANLDDGELATLVRLMRKARAANQPG